MRLLEIMINVTALAFGLAVCFFLMVLDQMFA